jgi:hypothetical protein
MNSVEVASYVSLTLFDGKSCWGGADVTNWFVGGSVLHPESSRRDGGWVGLQVCGAMVVGLEGRPAIKREPYERLVLESAVDLGCCFDRDRKSRRGRQRYERGATALACAGNLVELVDAGRLGWRILRRRLFRLRLLLWLLFLDLDWGLLPLDGLFGPLLAIALFGRIGLPSL